MKVTTIGMKNELRVQFMGVGESWCLVRKGRVRGTGFNDRIRVSWQWGTGETTFSCRSNTLRFPKDGVGEIQTVPRSSARELWEDLQEYGFQAV